jgi:hypothetical protein
MPTTPSPPHRTTHDHQAVMEVVQACMAGARILKFLPGSDELIQGGLPVHVSHAWR